MIIESGLRSIAASFPVFASLATGWSEYKNIKQEERIYHILEEFGRYLTVIKNNIDQDYIKSDEAKRLIEQTINKGKDELREEKRRQLASFLSNASTKELSWDNEKDMVLDTISKLSPMQVEILKIITENLVLTRGQDNVKLGSNYDADSTERPTFGYVTESSLVNLMLKFDTVENIESSLDYMLAIGIIEGANSRGWTRVGLKTGIRGFRPTKLGIKTLRYLGTDIEQMHVE